MINKEGFTKIGIFIVIIIILVLLLIGIYILIEISFPWSSSLGRINFKGNPQQYDTCEKIKGGYGKDLCYSYIAFATKDELFCLNIKSKVSITSGDFERYIYQENCLSIVAGLKNQPELCQFVRKTGQERCLKIISLIANGTFFPIIEIKEPVTFNDCAFLSKDEMRQCVAQLPEEVKSKESCPLRLVGVPDQYCLMNIVIIELNTEFCANTPDPIYCYNQIAKLKDDVSICEKIEQDIDYSYNRDYCYYLLADSEEDCKSIESSIRNDCYLQIVEKRFNLDPRLKFFLI